MSVIYCPEHGEVDTDYDVSHEEWCREFNYAHTAPHLPRPDKRKGFTWTVGICTLLLLGIHLMIFEYMCHTNLPPAVTGHTHLGVRRAGGDGGNFPPADPQSGALSDAGTKPGVGTVSRR